MRSAPPDRLALGVVGLLLAAGTVQYALRAPAPEWTAAQAGADEPVAALAARAEAEAGRARRRAVPLAPGETIDPNTADVDELQRLPRVGPALARAIVEHREAHGAFRSLADLDRVPGIGPATLARLAPLVALPPAAPVPPAPPSGAAAPPGTAAAAGAVDINTADAAELQRLPGIGPVLAERIVAWRQEHGRFASVQELARVPGIGARTVERLAPHARVGP